MSAAIVNDVLDLLDIKHDKIPELPCQVSLSDTLSLAVFSTQFDHLSFTIILDIDSATKWSDSDIIEYFIDDDTQFFITEYHATFSKADDTLGFSKSVKPEKVEIIRISNFVRDAKSELSRFMVEFTPL